MISFGSFGASIRLELLAANRKRLPYTESSISLPYPLRREDSHKEMSVPLHFDVTDEKVPELM